MIATHRATKTFWMIELRLAWKQYRGAQFFGHLLESDRIYVRHCIKNLRKFS